MNDWYIDRSKNFINDTFDSMLSCFASMPLSSNDTNELIKHITSSGALGKAGGNPNAALTRFRDHGLLDNANKIGESAQDYLEGKLTRAELIIDLFLKRPAKKHNSPNIKPFVALCKVFDIMMDISNDPDDIFITFAECYEYLYACDSYTDITYELVEKILTERNYSMNNHYPANRVKLADNEDVNISIWFNALKETPIFLPQDDARQVLIPNQKQREFFRFISINADELIETPTSTNNDLYNYYCKRESGLIELLPKVVKTSAKIQDEKDIQILFEYLFGYKKEAKFNYGRYLKHECFGIFFPFITVPRLALRHIWLYNEEIGTALFKLVAQDNTYLSLFNEGKFEYKGLVKFVGKNKKKNLPIFSYSTIVGNANNRVVYGTPGCGKSYYVQNKYLSQCGVSKEHRIRTTFYMDYTNTDFVGQILPKVHEDGDKRTVTYDFNPGPFALALKMAIENPNEAVALIIEELNRGNAASIFGDIFQLLDRDKNGKSQYSITNTNLQDYLNKCFDGVYTFDGIQIPANLYIVATMNTSDQNVFTLDTAFKRRWQFEKLRNVFAADHQYKGYYIPGMKDVTWEKLVNSINKFIVNRPDDLSSEDKQLGVYFIDESTLCATKEECNNAEKIEKFAYKLFEYLWDDVAKFAHPDWFGADIKTLDQLIDRYKTIGEKVFVEGVIE